MSNSSKPRTKDAASDGVTNKSVRTGFTIALATGVAACGGGHVSLPTLAGATVGDTAGLVARGEYLVRYVANCRATTCVRFTAICAP